MATGSKYKVAFRRRREQKTNYHQRRKIMTSKKLRVVVRQSNKHYRVQLIESTLIGDKVHTSCFSKELDNYGWIGAKHNIPGAYLSGYLFGKRAIKAGHKEAIFDIGLQTSIWGSRIFAVLKGVIDSGLQVPYDEKVFPNDDRISGKHIAEYAKMLKKDDKEKFDRYFGNDLKVKFDPTKIDATFKKTKDQIDSKEG